MSGLNLGNKKDESKDDAKKVEQQDGTPAFGKHGGGLDENDPLTDGDQVKAAANLAEAASENPGADLAAVVADANAPDGKVTYTSHPIERYKLGEYQFEKGALHLDSADAAKFDELLEAAKKIGQAHNVRKIDVDSANALAAQFLSNKRTRGVDTSADRPN